MEWIKRHKWNILFSFVVFCISFFIYAIILTGWCDQVWSFGFSYNISKGLIIYRDFNVLQTPFYFMLASIFIKIFGPYFISTQILDSMILTAIFMLMFQKIRWKAIIPYLLILFYPSSPYNLCCLLFLMIIIYLCDKEQYHEYFIAFLVGLSFITKQNIGILLFIPMIFYSKHKIRSIFVFFIPFIILSIYLLINHAFIHFIDYCFLGMLSFAGNSSYAVLFIVLEVIIILYLLYKLFKSKFRDKKVFYLLMFQFIVFPLCESRHVVSTIFCFLYFLLEIVENKRIVIIISSIVLTFLFFLTSSYFHTFYLETRKNLFYLKKQTVVSKSLEEVAYKYKDHLENVYYDSELTYLLRIYTGVPINKLDFYMDGNIGFINRASFPKELKKKCDREVCYFLLVKNPDDDLQFKEFRAFVKKHYTYLESTGDLEIYTSKK